MRGFSSYSGGMLLTDTALLIVLMLFYLFLKNEKINKAQKQEHCVPDDHEAEKVNLTARRVL